MGKTCGEGCIRAGKEGIDKIGGASEISPTRKYLKGKRERLTCDMPVENPFLYRISSIVCVVVAHSPPLEHSRSRCFLKTKSCSACLYSRIKGNILSYHRSIECPKCSSTHMIAFFQQRKELCAPSRPPSPTSPCPIGRTTAKTSSQRSSLNPLRSTYTTPQLTFQ